MNAERPWPEPAAPEAFHGLAGAFVNAADPVSEADRQALLGQFLVVFGSAAGRNAYTLAEADRHYPNEFSLIVGATGSGKGSSIGHIRVLFDEALDGWYTSRVMPGGLSSGEGIIEYMKQQSEPDDPTADGTEEENSAPSDGAEVRRCPVLLVVEPEFQRPLAAMNRQGNTLSAVVRSAWDTGRLATLTKSVSYASKGHFSLIAHVTPEDLKANMKPVDAANGLANRMLFFMSRRHRSIPFSTGIPDTKRAELGHLLRKAVEYARQPRYVFMSECAMAEWREAYQELTREVPGLLGKVLGRGRAHVLRLSLIYALLDLSPEIKAVHVRAALALWDYCARSAAYLFGGAGGNALADTVLTALRGNPDGLSLTTISGSLFKRNRTAAEIGAALASLQERGVARREMRPPEGGVGRAGEWWFAADRDAPTAVGSTHTPDEGGVLCR